MSGIVTLSFVLYVNLMLCPGLCLNLYGKEAGGVI